MILQIPSGYSFTATDLKSAIQQAGQSILNPLSDEVTERVAQLLLPWNFSMSDLIAGGHKKVVACVASYLDSSASNAVTKWFKSAARKDFTFREPVVLFTKKCSTTAEAFAELGSVGVFLGALGASLSYEVVTPSATQGIKLVPTSAKEVSRWARLHWDYKSWRQDSLFHLPADSAISYVGLRVAKKIVNPIVRYAAKLEGLGFTEVLSLAANVRGLFTKKAETASWLTPEIPAILGRQTVISGPFALKRKTGHTFMLVDQSQILTFLLNEKAEDYVNDGVMHVWKMSEVIFRDQDSLVGSKHALALFAYMAGVGSISPKDVSFERFEIDAKKYSLIDFAFHVHSPALRHMLGNSAGYGDWRGSMVNVGAIEVMDRSKDKLEAGLIVPVSYVSDNKAGGSMRTAFESYATSVGLELTGTFCVSADFAWFDGPAKTYTCCLTADKDELSAELSSAKSALTESTTFSAFEVLSLSATPKEV